MEIRCIYCQPKPILAEEVDGKIIILCRCCKRKNEVGNVKSLEDRTGGHDDDSGNGVCSCVNSDSADAGNYSSS